MGGIVGRGVGGGGVSAGSDMDVMGKVAVKKSGIVVGVLTVLPFAPQAQRTKANAMMRERGLEITNEFYPGVPEARANENRLALRRAAGTPEQTRTALFGSGGRRSVH